MTLKHLKKSCNSFNKTSKELNEKGFEIDKKLCDLESRSMCENLLFYGIQEGGEKEDCGIKVKELLRDILHMENVESILFDRANRVGQRSNKPRPIVVNFHFYGECEKVRQTSYNCTDELKAANLGIGIQIPKQIREGRKPLKKDDLMVKLCSLMVRSTPMTHIFNTSGVMKSDHLRFFLGTYMD